MEWISLNEELPEVDADGQSEYVLVCNVRTRAIPMIVQYSNGEFSKKGWWTQTFKHIPLHRKSKQTGTTLTFTHWAKIELPKEV